MNLTPYPRFHVGSRLVVEIYVLRRRPHDAHTPIHTQRCVYDCKSNRNGRREGDPAEIEKHRNYILKIAHFISRHILLS